MKFQKDVLLKNENLYDLITSHIDNNIKPIELDDEEFSQKKKLIIFFQKISTFLNERVEEYVLIKLYQNLLNSEEINLLILQSKLTELIKEYQFKKQYYQIEQLLFNLIDNILGHQLIQKKIQKRFQEKKSNDNNPNFIQIIDLNNDDCNSSMSLCIDYECNFFIRKLYKNHMKQDIIDAETKIFEKSFNDVACNIPNFVVHTDTIINSNTYIPYFPFQTLHSFLTQQKNGEILFSNIDKIVIMKEIAIAFSQLHKNGIFHQNLNSSFIYISETKNAYIGGFAHDTNIESINTKCNPSIFYRNNKKQNINGPVINEINNENETFIKNDIYSYGILVYEIVTTKQPVELFNRKTRAEIFNILNESYYEFLFEQYNNVDFDEFYQLNGIKQIITKCLFEENFYFDDVINDINELMEYKENKDEIEYRIKNADCSNTYKCKLSNIVMTYLQGDYNSFLILKSFLNIFQSNINYANQIQFEKCDEVIKIFSVFFEFNQINDDMNDNLFFEKYFDLIINDAAFSFMYNEKVAYDRNQSLIKYSKKKSMKSNIIPITSLKNFLNFFEIKNYEVLFIFFIAKELSNIHSKNLFHGRLSMDSIGIYFNTKTNTFLPAIIPFYIFYANEKNDQFFFHNQSYNYIRKMQKKDIKNFLHIVRNLDENLFKKLSIISEIYSIDNYLNEIFNIILESQNDELKQTFFANYSNFNYSLFQLKFKKIYNILMNSNQNSMIYKVFNKFFVQQQVYSNIEISLHKIIDFSNQMILKQNKNFEIKPNNDEHDIKNLFLMIKNNNYIALQISENLEKQKNQKTKECNEILTYHDKRNNFFKLINYSINEKNLRDQKNIAHSEFYVNRTLEITDLDIRSIKFIINRYIKELNPILNFRITIRLINKYDCFRQTKQYKLADIEKIVNKLHYRYEVHNGLIIILINKT